MTTEEKLKTLLYTSLKSPKVEILEWPNKPKNGNIGLWYDRVKYLRLSTFVKERVTRAHDDAFISTTEDINYIIDTLTVVFSDGTPNLKMMPRFTTEHETRKLPWSLKTLFIGRDVKVEKHEVFYELSMGNLTTNLGLEEGMTIFKTLYEKDQVLKDENAQKARMVNELILDERLKTIENE